MDDIRIRARTLQMNSQDCQISVLDAIINKRLYLVEDEYIRIWLLMSYEYPTIIVFVSAPICNNLQTCIFSPLEATTQDELKLYTYV